MTYDELFVQIVKDATFNQVNNRLYHLEVYQLEETAKVNYPCVLYNLRSNMPNGGPEISGKSGYMMASYDVVVVSKNSDILRDCAQNIYDLSEEDPNWTNSDLYRDLGFDWIDVDMDVENVEYAVELEGKGYKTTTICVLLYHRELANNARSQ